MKNLGMGAVAWVASLVLLTHGLQASTCQEVLSRFLTGSGSSSLYLSPPRWTLPDGVGGNSKKPFEISGTIDFVSGSPDIRVVYEFRSGDQESNIFVRYSPEKNLWAMQVNLAREEGGEFTDPNLVRSALDDILKKVLGGEDFLIRVNDPILVKALNEAIGSEINFRGLDLRSGDEDFYDPRQFGYIRMESREEAAGLAAELADTEAIKARLRAQVEMTEWNEVLEGRTWELVPKFDVVEREELHKSDSEAWDIVVSYSIQVEREELFPRR